MKSEEEFLSFPPFAILSWSLVRAASVYFSLTFLKIHFAMKKGFIYRRIFFEKKRFDKNNSFRYFKALQLKLRIAICFRNDLLFNCDIFHQWTARQKQSLCHSPLSRSSRTRRKKKWNFTFHLVKTAIIFQRANNRSPDFLFTCMCILSNDYRKSNKNRLSLCSSWVLCEVPVKKVQVKKTKIILLPVNITKNISPQF